MKRFAAFFLGSLSALVLLLLFHFGVNLPYFSTVFHKLELQTLDYRMKFAKQADVSEAIKIVLVNDAANLSEKLAAFTQLVASGGNGAFKPKVIGFNYLFDASSVNENLISTVSIANNVYYGYSFQFDSQQSEQPGAPNQDILPFRLEITNIGESDPKVFQAQDVRMPARKYLTTARGIGFANTLPDRDGIFRRIPLFLR